MSLRAAAALLGLVAALGGPAAGAEPDPGTAPEPYALRTVAGGHGAGHAPALASRGGPVAYADGTLYYLTPAVDHWQLRLSVLRALDVATGRERVVAGGARPHELLAGETAPAASVRLVESSVVAAGPGGTVYVVEGDRVVRVRDGFASMVAGGGTGCCGEAYDAGNLSFERPTALAVDPADGTLYVADDLGYGYARIWRVRPDGRYAVVAGPGGAVDGCTTGPALSVRFERPQLAVDPAGRLLVSADECVRRVESDGRVVVVAGGGTVDGSAADGGPATAARLEPGPIAAYGADLYLLDRRRVRRVDADGVLHTVAGNGQERPRDWFDDRPLTAAEVGDGAPATSVPVLPWGGVAAGPEGVWFGDSDGRVRVVVAGVLGTAAGNGRRDGGDGGPAVDAELASPRGVAATPDGGFVVTDLDAHAVRRVAPDGTIATIAGVGAVDTGRTENSHGDGGPATAARVTRPTAVAVGPDGSVYVAHDRARVRRIDPAGTITTVAGNGGYEPRGDDVPATETAVFATGLDVGPDGSLYLTDAGSHSVRRIGPDGVIRRVAGGNGSGFSGDGGPALLAAFNSPADVEVRADGGFYVADAGNHRVRLVTPGGLITTVAGGGPQDGRWQGDGGPALSAHLPYPHDVEAAPDGTLFVAAADRVRRVRAGLVHGVAGRWGGGYVHEGGPDEAPAGTYPFVGLGGIGLRADGRLLVAEPGPGRVRELYPDGPPGPPRGVTPTAGQGRADVRWLPPAGYDGSPVASYTVTARPADGSAATTRTVPGTESRTTLTGLRNGVDHTVTVVAANPAGASPASDPAVVRPRAEPPGPPRYPTARRAGDSAAEVHWVLPGSDGGAPVDRYRVVASPGGAQAEVPGGTTTLVVRGLANGTAYRFTVAARNAAGWGPASEPSEPVVPDGPPAVSVTATGALLEPAVLRFDEPVRDVTAANLLLRDRATGASVPLAPVCRDAACADLSSAEDALRSVAVRPRSPLPAGATYDLYLNAPGTGPPVVDLDGLPAPATVRGLRAATVEEEGTVGGRRLWRQVRDDRAEGGQYAVDHQPGATATARVSGTSVTWLTAVGPGMGRAELWVDGVRRGTYDNRAGAYRWRVPRTVGGLPPGAHTVQVRVVGAGRVVVDSLGGAVGYEWRRVVTAAAAGGGFGYADQPGAETSFVFRGTAVAWAAVRGPAYGRVAVYVDGRRYADVDYRAGSVGYGYRRGVSGLPAGVHTVRLVVLSGALGLDRWQVTG